MPNMPAQLSSTGQRNSTSIRALADRVRKAFTSRLPDKLYTSLVYKREFGVFPNLDKPRTFNEKICYRRVHPDPIYTPLSDKVLVRDYVRMAVGEHHLIPCYGTAERLTESLYKQLPKQFVMKGNHGSGYNFLVRDKADYPFETLKRISDTWLNENFYDVSRERHYKDIEPQLLFEKLLLGEDGKVPKDYKFYCFRKKGQEPKVFIEVAQDRFINVAFDYYDADWNLVEVVEDKFTTGVAIPKPAMLDEAIEVALRLSSGFNFVRVDLYLTDDRIYFGELTFTPTGGLKHFKTPAIDLAWGGLFDHPGLGGELVPEPSDSERPALVI